MPVRIAVFHHAGNGRDVNLQRIDMEIGQPNLLGQPGGQGFEVKRPMRRFGASQPLVGDNHQWMQVARLMRPRRNNKIARVFL